MISAIIPSKNNDETLDACLESVVNSLPYDKEVIVVDGHSTDSTPKILAKYRDKIKVVYDEGKGLGRARNVGVKNAKYDIIAFVDSDVICAKDHFLRILDYFKEHPDVGAVDTDGVHPRAGTNIQKMESLFFESVERYYPRQLNLRGWSIALRRSAFDAVGGFWRGGGEDNEFSYKLRAKGIKMATVKTESWHMQRRTLIGLLKEMRLWGRDAAYFYHVWGNTPTFIQDHRKRKIFRVLHNAKVIEPIANIVAPITGIKYFVMTKSPSLCVHFIVRQYAFLFGYIQGNFDILVNSPRLPWRPLHEAYLERYG